MNSSLRIFRAIVHKFLTEARIDIGVYTDAVRYLGKRQ